MPLLPDTEFAGPDHANPSFVSQALVDERGWLSAVAKSRAPVDRDL